MARLSQIFAPKDRVFFNLFEEAAANALRAAELLDEMLRSFPEHNDLARAILLCEQEGDRITYDMIQRLNATFVTPIDREDILELASGLDDMTAGVAAYAEDVRTGRYPAPEHGYSIPEDELAGLRATLQAS